MIHMIGRRAWRWFTTDAPMTCTGQAIVWAIFFACALAFLWLAKFPV